MATRVTGMIFAHEQECYTANLTLRELLNGSANEKGFSRAVKL
jgi:hypothetical protein